MGFAQEIKDFLSAAQAGQKIFGARNDEEYKRLRNQRLQQQIDKDNDPETDKLKKDEARARLGLTNARIGLVGDRRKKLRETPAVGAAPQLDMTAPEFAPRTPYEAPAMPAVPTAPGPQSAIQPTNQFADAEDDTEDRMFSATGGMVQRFADGGMVDDADYGAESDYAPEDEGDVAATPAIGAPTDISARSRTPTSFSQEAAHDAVKDGLNYGVRSFGLDQRSAVADNSRGQSYRAYASGKGAAPVADMDAVRKAVDPQGRMGESERNLAALSAVYQFKLNHGDTKGAQSAAFAMLQYYRVASQRYAALAHAAAEQGDIDGAAKAAMRAYANVPDGKDLKITKTKDGQLAYTFTDEKTGKQISKGIASPAQLASAAMGVASQGFDQFLLQAAGQRSAGGKRAAVGGGAPKQSDLKSIREGLNEAFDKVAPADESTGKSSVPEDELEAARGGAYRIMADPRNTNILPTEAAKIALNLAREPKNPDKPDFSVKRLDDGGGYEVKFGSKPPVFVNENDFDALAAMRSAKISARKKQKEKSDADSKKPGLLSEMGSAISKYADDAAKNNPEQPFPGGTSRAQVEDDPVGAVPAGPRPRPYIPFAAGGR